MTLYQPVNCIVTPTSSKMPPRKKKAADTSKLEDELSTLPLDQLRKELKEVGVEAGPIDATSRAIYVRMLARKKLQLTTEPTDKASIQPIFAVRSPTSSGQGGGVVSPRIELARKPLTNSGTAGRGMKRPAASLARGSASPSVSPVVSKRKKFMEGEPSSSRKKAVPKLTGRPQKTTAEVIRDFKVVGLTAAAFTPFTSEGELNLPVISQYVDWLLSCGVKNVFLNGTTGESLSLTVEERKILVEEWLKVAAGRLKVIVHVGTENLQYTCELASHAEEAGAEAIGVMPTTFFKPPSIDHLIMYLESVAEVAPHLPMYYYHIPSATGVRFSMEEFLDNASSRLPTLRGLKYTDTDLFEFGRCVTNQGEKYQIIYGSDQQLIGALALGGIAAIGSTYNYAGKLYNRLFLAYQKRNTAEAMLEQRRSQAMVKLLDKYGSHPGGGKAFMKICGIDCGPPRLPFLPITPEAMRSLESDLTEIGFFEWS